ncbi:ATP phosphoribosyltransferase regulatory subunit [Bordetella parapertussis]|uniref:ATP phosphoribosyltransferase regulatory subunit n=1 Tax=Bordetella parapertussis TaxID=519 RepID=UPI000A67610F
MTRLCYCGSVLHARPDLLSSRELLQIGAEIYGHAGFEADLEIIQLVMDTLATAGVRQCRLDLCHSGVMRAIFDADPQASRHAGDLCTLLREKDVPGLANWRAVSTAGRGYRARAAGAGTLYGGPRSSPGAARAAGGARHGAGAGRPAGPGRSMPGVTLSVDLADVGGYGYHSGVTFAVYGEDWPTPGARRPLRRCQPRFRPGRPATGFSLDCASWRRA